MDVKIHFKLTDGTNTDLISCCIKNARGYSEESIQKRVLYKIFNKYSPDELKFLLNERSNENYNILIEEITSASNHQPDLKLIHFLIVNGSDLNFRDKNNFTAMNHAVNKKNSNITELIFYHLTFVGTKEQQKVFPAHLFEQISAKKLIMHCPRHYHNKSSSSSWYDSD
jgi:hypothetical protein